jgi:hypothetical protein
MIKSSFAMDAILAFIKVVMELMQYRRENGCAMRVNSERINR